MNRILYLILILFVIASCSKHQANPAPSSNPADSATWLTISVGDSVGSVTQNASSDTFLIKLKNPGIVKAVPVILHFAAGATPSEGKQLTDSTWSDTVDVSRNQIHPITMTSKSGKTAKYGIGFSYVITNYAFLGQPTVFAVAAHGDTVYAGYANGLAISTDGGMSFNKTITLSTGPGITSIAVQNSTVYAGMLSEGLMISPDGGQTIQFYKFSADSSDFGINNSIMAVYAQGDTVYAGSAQGGLYISHDRGNSFFNLSATNGLGIIEVNGIYAQGSTVYVASTKGIFISYDGGASFVSTNFGNIAKSMSGSSTCNALAVSNGVIYAAYGNGLWESKDNGVTFTGVINADIDVAAISIQGNMICAATLDNGLMVSMDGGTTFTSYSISSGLIGDVADAVAIQGGTIYIGFEAAQGGVSVMVPR